MVFGTQRANKQIVLSTASPSCACRRSSRLFVLMIALAVGCLVGWAAFLGGLLVAKSVSPKRAGLKGLLIAVITAPVSLCATYWILGNALYSGMYPPTPRQKPSEQDIVGHWELTEGSVQYLRDEEPVTVMPTLDFRANKTFAMKGLPDLVCNCGESQGSYLSGSGTWSIEKDINGDWVVRTFFLESDIGKTNFRSDFDLYGREGPYFLNGWLGDPDEGQIISFEKRK